MSGDQSFSGLHFKALSLLDSYYQLQAPKQEAAQTFLYVMLLPDGLSFSLPFVSNFHWAPSALFPNTNPD